MPRTADGCPVELAGAMLAAAGSKPELPLTMGAGVVLLLQPAVVRTSSVAKPIEPSRDFEKVACDVFMIVRNSDRLP